MAVDPAPYIQDVTPSRLALVPFDQIRLDTAPAYLVKGLVPREGLTVVWGPPKCGKSFWTFDLTMHVALGRPYRGPSRSLPGPHDLRLHPARGRGGAGVRPADRSHLGRRLRRARAAAA